MVSLNALLILCLSALGWHRGACRPAVEGPETLESGENFYKGHDLSSLKILEEGGAIFHDSARHNVTRAAEDILGDGGMNTVRLR